MEFNKRTEDRELAKQRATIKWLLSKAYNNKVPDTLKDPFYTDHQDQEHIKPNLVYSLANAELYCLALGNIYSDPNYHNLNHCGVIQCLARKGIYLSDPQLTETILIQTSPLKLSAHICVMEAIMSLYAKEVATLDRVQAAIQTYRQSHGTYDEKAITDHEHVLLLWLNETVSAFKQKALSSSSHQVDGKIADINAVNDWSDLGDGVALSVLISFYCNQHLPSKEIRINKPSSLSDCLHNLHLVHNFCQTSLPYNVFHMTPEDVSFIKKGSMRLNLIVLLADLFNLLEIHPAKCVEFEDASKKAVASKMVQGGSSSNTSSPSVTKKLNHNHQQAEPKGQFSQQPFVVHIGKSIPTISSINNKVSSNGLNGNVNNKSQGQTQSSGLPTNGAQVAAGKPTSWEDSRKVSFSGRRSRRNSISDESQLTLENFGGSQDNIHLLGRNPDKEPAIVLCNKQDEDSRQMISQLAAQDKWGSSGVDSLLRNNYKDDDETTVTGTTTYARNNSTIGIVRSFSNLAKRNNAEELSSSGLQQSLYDCDNNVSPKQTFNVKRSNSYSEPKVVTSFAALPANTTTWQQQKQESTMNINAKDESDTNGVMSSQMLNVRLKLEEKRRQIESEKRRIEVNLNRQRQKLGKAAFLQAVSKGGGDNCNGDGESDNSTSENQRQDIHLEDTNKGNENNRDISTDRGEGYSSTAGVGDNVKVNNNQLTYRRDSLHNLQHIRPTNLTVQDIADVEQRWLRDDSKLIPTPDSDSMDIEQCQKSISQMDSSLHEIQADLQWLTNQENEIRQKHNFIPFSPQTTEHHTFTHQQQPHGQIHAQVQSHGYPEYSTYIQQSQLIQPIPHSQHFHYPQQQNPYNTYVTQHQANNSLVNFQHRQQQQQQINSLISRAVNEQYTGERNEDNRWHSLRASSANDNNNYYDMRGNNLFVANGESMNEYNTHPESKQEMQSSQFYLHQQPTSSSQRRTWAESPSLNTVHDSHNVWTPNTSKTANRNYSNQYMQQQQQQQQARPQQTVSLSSSPRRTFGFSLQNGGNANNNGYQIVTTTASLQTMPESPPIAPTRQATKYQASVPSPSADDMAPQSISFIGTQEEHNQLSESLSRLQITSGSRTYRIPSPTRAHAHATVSGNSFNECTSNINSSNSEEKGFYISFDDNTQMKRPKPPLRAKKASPKKDRALTQVLHGSSASNNASNTVNKMKTSGFNDTSNVANESRFATNGNNKVASASAFASDVPPTSNCNFVQPVSNTSLAMSNPVGLVIHSANSSGAVTVDEMEKKKERILMLSLQRRQEQEEMKARKEIESQKRREKEKQKEEDRTRKKDEEKQRRAAILEKHRLKKAIEEAERQGKPIDRELLNAVKPNTSNALPLRLRGRTQTVRPRPKTIHVDTGGSSVSDLPDGTLTPSRGKKGSSSNLSAVSSNSSMRRDYYRGSQDCLLADTCRTSASSIYSDVVDDDHHTSSTGRSIGRRGSYKASRDVSLDRGISRIGRSKFSTYQSHTPRKSSSLMNLSGSSCDQDSLLCRYADTDSGLGRATPPPGQATSPCGPGSLPPARRRYDVDTASESGGSEYSGPRLYKQPATKCNRGIILNAVEYCVFPGVVNREAKRRVIEEMNRSDAKHFLILFRDAGCQFRALYSYFPDTEEIFKLYGTGPKQVTDRMFDRFFKYNSGGKCFSQVHTKHLTVTIDAFTIHNSLWQGKKVNLPNKRDMALVI